MRTAIWFSSSRGERVLRDLIQTGHRVTAVIVPSDDPLFRELASSFGVKLFQWGLSSEAELSEFLLSSGTELGVIAGFPRLIPMPIAEIPEFGSINLHGGPLPEFRGGSPLAWQIIEGRTEITVSIHRVEEEFDTGGVLATASFSLGPREGIREAKLKSEQVFSSLLLELLEKPTSTFLNLLPQDAEGARYLHQRTYEDAEIHWHTMTAQMVCNLVRATSPDYGGAFSWLGPSRLRVFEATVADIALAGTPGRVVSFGNREAPLIVCAKGGVELREYELVDCAEKTLKSGLQLGFRQPSSTSCR